MSVDLDETLQDYEGNTFTRRQLYADALAGDSGALDFTSHLAEEFGDEPSLALLHGMRGYSALSEAGIEPGDLLPAPEPEPPAPEPPKDYGSDLGSAIGDFLSERNATD